jgi:hypothetical protein
MNRIDYEAYGPRPDYKGEFDQEELQLALDWTLETFKPLIIGEMPNPDVPVILFVEHVITKNDKMKGIFDYPVGTTIRYSLKAEIFAKLYFDIIMDDRIKYNKDATAKEKSDDKIAHILELDKHFQIGHGTYIKMARDRGII